MALPRMHKEDRMKITPRITQALRRKRGVGILAPNQAFDQSRVKPGYF